MVKFLRQPAVLLSLLIAGFSPASAQMFNAPVADEFIFGDPAASNLPKVTANYSHRDIPTAFGVHDLYLSSWSTNNPGGGSISEFMCMFTAPSTPTAVSIPGLVPLPGRSRSGSGYGI